MPCTSKPLFSYSQQRQLCKHLEDFSVKTEIKATVISGGFQCQKRKLYHSLMCACVREQGRGRVCAQWPRRNISVASWMAVCLIWFELIDGGGSGLAPDTIGTQLCNLLLPDANSFFFLWLMFWLLAGRPVCIPQWHRVINGPGHKGFWYTVQASAAYKPLRSCGPPRKLLRCASRFLSTTA